MNVSHTSAGGNAGRSGDTIDTVVEVLRLVFDGTSPTLQRLAWRVCGRRGPIVSDDALSDDLLEDR
jgi:hypothetical protein